MVLPPHGLFHPVLPYRHAGKLTFPLCASCMTEEMSKPFLEKERSQTAYAGQDDVKLHVG